MKKFVEVVLKRSMSAMAKVTFSGKRMARHGTVLHLLAVLGLAVLSLLNYVALGQLSGSAALSGAGQFAGIDSCQMPNPCAYNGVDLIQWGTIPNFSLAGSYGTLNNYQVGYDTSFIGHTNFDGSTFSNSAYLSPIYRVTDQAAIVGNVKQGFAAGQGSSGGRPNLTNTDTTLISISGTGGAYYIGRFNPSGPNQGFLTSNSQNLPSPEVGIGSTSWYYNGSTPYPPVANGTVTDSASVITSAQKTAGNCSSNCTAVNFAGIKFDSHVNSLLYVWGNNTDITNQTTITPEVINPVTGQYTVGSPIVDFQYGIPGTNSSEWTIGTPYSYGQYVLHTLSTAEMATGGVWTSGHTYVPGDIVTSQSGLFCAYKVATASGSATSGSAPAFKISSCGTETLTDSANNKWNGLAMGTVGAGVGPQFVYQEVNPACTVGSPCTSAGSAFQWLATPTTLVSDGALASGSQVLTSASNPFSAAIAGQTIQIVNAGNAGGTIPLNTTVASYQNAGQVTLAAPVLKTGGISGATVLLTGHPDIISSTVGDAHGLVWQNAGPNLPIAGGTGWFDGSDLSDDQLYPITVGGTGYNAPKNYATAISTNTYHMAKSYSGAEDYSSGGAGQDTGFFVVEFDYNSGNPIYHMLNLLSGIWTDWSCSGGSGYNCSGGSFISTTVGTFKAITDPFTTGQPCPGTIHAARTNPTGAYLQITPTVARIYNPCTSLPNATEWATTTSTFDPYASYQVYYNGLNHSALGQNHIFSFNSSGWGTNAGVFVARYTLNNVSGTPCISGTWPDCPGTGNPVTGGGFPPPVTTYLYPIGGTGNQTQAQTVPPGCYVTGVGAGGIMSPDCNLSEVLDSHISRAGHISDDTFPACGTAFNYATLSPVAFNSWQGMEICQPTYPYVPTSTNPSANWSLPSASLAAPWQFTHGFFTGTSVFFSPQFGVSQFSQDGNWLFWSSDWACQAGSQSGSPPAVWTSGTYYQMLAVTGVPAAPMTTVYSLCGLPWLPLHSYAVGNLINPIEGTGGGGQIDDVFQAIYVGGTSGPNSSLGSNQPKCGATSCFASTNPPLCNGLSCATNPASAPFTSGDTVCDNQSGSGDVINPSLPYSSSCPTGIVWQDLGPGNARPDMFAVRLSH